MANTKKNELIVGIVVTAILALAIYVVVALADWSTMASDQQQLTIRLPYQTGLRGLMKGSPVYLGGVKVGVVTKTKLADPTEADISSGNFKVQFTMRLPEVYRVYDDCKLIPYSNVLGGQTMLVIDDLGSKGKLIADGQTVDIALGDDLMTTITKEFDPDSSESFFARLKYEINRENKDSIFASLANTSTNLSQITAKLDYHLDAQSNDSFMENMISIVDNLDKATQKIDSQLDNENQQGLIVRLNKTLIQMDNTLASADDLIDNAKPDFLATLRSLNKVTGALEKDIPVLMKQVQGSLAKIDTAIITADSALVSFKAFGDKLCDRTEVNKQKLDGIIANFHEVSSNMKLVSREVRRAPWKLLYEPKEKEVRLQAMVDTAGAFATGAERVDNAVETLRSLLSDDSTNTENIKSAIAELQTSLGKFKTAEDKLWEDLK
ncbi:MAG: hypothetical protein JEZ07_14255 [Phycisphaerae bacterium]|nr:hypothetical protein [Phycisphaerae bacterium]